MDAIKTSANPWAIELRSGALPVAGFRWRTQFGEMLLPSEMATRHVFYTWLLIWNHACPPALVRKEGRKYDGFGKWYTPARMLTAFGVMMVELQKRNDLSPEFRKIVREVMVSYAKWQGYTDCTPLLDVCSR